MTNKILEDAQNLERESRISTGAERHACRHRALSALKRICADSRRCSSVGFYL